MCAVGTRHKSGRPANGLRAYEQRPGAIANASGSLAPTSLDAMGCRGGRGAASVRQERAPQAATPGGGLGLWRRRIDGGRTRRTLAPRDVARVARGNDLHWDRRPQAVAAGLAGALSRRNGDLLQTNTGQLSRSTTHDARCSMISYLLQKSGCRGIVAGVWASGLSPDRSSSGTVLARSSLPSAIAPHRSTRGDRGVEAVVEGPACDVPRPRRRAAWAATRGRADRPGRGSRAWSSARSAWALRARARPIELRVSVPMPTPAVRRRGSCRRTD